MVKICIFKSQIILGRNSLIMYLHSFGKYSSQNLRCSSLSAILQVSWIENEPGPNPATNTSQAILVSNQKFIPISVNGKKLHFFTNDW